MKIKYLCSALVILVVSGCASLPFSGVPLSANEWGEAKKAIDLNDSTKLDDLLKKQNFGPEFNYRYSCLLSYTLHRIMDDKTLNEKNECRPEIVRLLTEKGAEFTERTVKESHESTGFESLGYRRGEFFDCEMGQQLSDLILRNSTCTDLIAEIVSKIPPSDSASALFIAYDNIARKGDQVGCRLNSDCVTNTVKVTPNVIQALNEKCSNESGDKNSCNLAKQLTLRKAVVDERLSEVEKAAQAEARYKQSQKVEEQKAAAQSEYENSPQGQACSALNSIRLADAMIAHEKEVGKASGVIDKNALHQAGQIKVISQGNLTKLKTKYGEKLSLGQCKMQPLPY